MSMVATEALIRALPVEKIRGLQKGTVVADFEPVEDLRVTMDGDSSPSHVMSLCGELQADQRVMVVFTEPHGAYVAWLDAPPAWRALTLGSNWHNLGTVAGITYTDAAIRRVGDSVEIRGEIYATIDPASSAQATIATLPAGFRIPQTQGFPGHGGNGGFLSLYAFGEDVPAGFENLLFYQAGTAVATSEVSLASVGFSVTP